MPILRFGSISPGKLVVPGAFWFRISLRAASSADIRIEASTVTTRALGRCSDKPDDDMYIKHQVSNRRVRTNFAKAIARTLLFLWSGIRSEGLEASGRSKRSFIDCSTAKSLGTSKVTGLSAPRTLDLLTKESLTYTSRPCDGNFPGRQTA